MKQLAAVYYSHFFFGSKDGQLSLSLSESAPQHLKSMLRQVCGASPSQECMARFYECLCSLAEAEARLAPAEPDTAMSMAVQEALRTGLDA